MVVANLSPAFVKSASKPIHRLVGGGRGVCPNRAGVLLGLKNNKNNRAQFEIGASGSGHVEVRGTTFTSANQAMRKTFGLYANVRPAKNFKLPWPTRFDDVNIDMVCLAWA